MKLQKLLKTLAIGLAYSLSSCQTISLDYLSRIKKNEEVSLSTKFVAQHQLYTDHIMKRSPFESWKEAALCFESAYHESCDLSFLQAGTSLWGGFFYGVTAPLNLFCVDSESRSEIFQDGAILKLTDKTANTLETLLMPIHMIRGGLTLLSPYAPPIEPPGITYGRLKLQERIFGASQADQRRIQKLDNLFRNEDDSLNKGKLIVNTFYGIHNLFTIHDTELYHKQRVARHAPLPITLFTDKYLQGFPTDHVMFENRDFFIEGNNFAPRLPLFISLGATARDIVFVYGIIEGFSTSQHSAASIADGVHGGEIGGPGGR